MIDDRTAHYSLALPNQDNKLEDDVSRLRSAIAGVDTEIYAVALKLASDDPLLNTLQEIVDAAKSLIAKIERTEIPAKTTLTYTDGLVTTVSEKLTDNRFRTTVLTYNSGVLNTETVTLGGESYRTTYSYNNGVLTGSVRVKL
jgi:hypothetical protein